VRYRLALEQLKTGRDSFGSRQRGADACSFRRILNAQKAETVVWEAVCRVLRDPERFRQYLEAMIERERNNYSGPEAEAKAWATRLAEAEGKRDKYQEMYAADAFTLSELRDKLGVLEETRKTAERERALLEGRCESLRALEADKDRLLKAYTTLAPEALDRLGSEERRTVYSMLGLVVEVLPDEGLKVSGAFG
jgi:DNA repair exonuclease SbcCD ATPase subunit